ncbi:hypothetical protein JCM16303_000042 [Sporobolomyces ruberrimus]
MSEYIEVYDFEALAGGEHDLAGLLDEDSNAFNDETFGDDFGLGEATPVGRDFDFAGSTNRFLGSETTTSGVVAAHSSDSPWGTLNDDPLLSRAPPPPSSMPLAPEGIASAPVRPMKTLEEVEAEMRSAHRAPPVPFPGSTASPGPRPLTVDEVEAEMLRNSRQAIGGSVASDTPAPQPGPTPIPVHSQFPLPGFPPGVLPPGMPPAMIAMLQAQHQQQERQRLGQASGHPGSPTGPSPMQPLSAAAFPPLGSSPLPPSPARLGPNLMATLFPPLPSLGQQPLPPQPPLPAANLAQVEQQLHLLTLHQYAQHPSLTSAHLNSLLQQAQQHTAAAADESGAADRRKTGDDIIRQVELRILEHEQLEALRRRKASKIASMAKHNNLMSNSDKDFITRIQVSQLITDDPYADDFYFHIMAAIKNARQNAILAAINQNQGPAVVPGPTQGPPSGLTPQSLVGGDTQGGNRRPNRRENAMNRMAQNVQRLVDSAKKRNANTPNTLSLDGALGKIATRTRSAPRPLLQVSSARSSSALPTMAGSDHDSEHPRTSPPPGSTPSHNTGESLLTGAGLVASSAASHRATTQGPLTHRAALAIIEKLYDTVLDLEQLRRVQPTLLAAQASLKDQCDQMTVEGEVRDQMKTRLEKAKSNAEAGEAKYNELRESLWDGLRVMDPLDACVPHPFVSILSVLKGKRLLPRAIRHLSAEQTLTLLTLLVATFDTLDVVVDAPLLDQLDTTGSLEAKQRRLAVETKTEALLNAVIAPIMQVVGSSPLRMVTGMLGLLLDRNSLNSVIRSKPGLAFLTILLSRAESLNQADPAPDAADLAQWQRTFTYLFSVLSPSLLPLFPSTRMAASVPFGVAQYQSVDALRPEADVDDEPVWRFLAAVAVCADPDQQQVLVTGVRDKVIEGVRGAKMGRGGPEVSAVKIRNVNLLLHALSLDASMIETEE